MSAFDQIKLKNNRFFSTPHVDLGQKSATKQARSQSQIRLDYTAIPGKSKV